MASQQQSLVPPELEPRSSDRAAAAVDLPQQLETGNGDPSPVYVLGIPMHKLSRPVQFVVCFCGIVFFYLLYGYSQVCT